MINDEKFVLKLKKPKIERKRDKVRKYVQENGVPAEYQNRLIDCILNDEDRKKFKQILKKHKFGGVRLTREELVEM